MGDDFAYILDTFEVLRRNEARRWGEFRTKRLVLETYDGLAAAMASGRSYQTPLESAAGRCARRPTVAQRAGQACLNTAGRIASATVSGGSADGGRLIDIE